MVQGNHKFNMTHVQYTVGMYVTHTREHNAMLGYIMTHM